MRLQSGRTSLRTVVGRLSAEPMEEDRGVEGQGCKICGLGHPGLSMLNTKSGLSSAGHRDFMNHISDPTLKANLDFYKGKKNFLN